MSKRLFCVVFTMFVLGTVSVYAAPYTFSGTVGMADFDGLDGTSKTALATIEVVSTEDPDVSANVTFTVESTGPEGGNLGTANNAYITVLTGNWAYMDSQEEVTISYVVNSVTGAAGIVKEDTFTGFGGDSLTEVAVNGVFVTADFDTYVFPNGTAFSPSQAYSGGTDPRIRLSWFNFSFSLSSPFLAQNPSPLDGQEYVSILDLNSGASMGWDILVDPNTTGWFITVDTDPNLVVDGSFNGFTDSGSGNGTIEYDPTFNFEADKEYYWRVDTSINNSTPNDPNTVAGDVWSFNTYSFPVYEEGAGPVDVKVFVDESATFAADFSATLAGGTVTWYKVDNSGADVELTSTSLLAGTQTYTLDLGSVALSDEGSYYAVAENSGGQVTSDVADLVIKQLLAQYDFESTLAPAVGSVVDAPIGQGKSIDGLVEPNEPQAVDVAVSFVDGIAGGLAVQIDPNEYVDFTVNGYPRAGEGTVADGSANGWGRGLDAGTVIFWVKTTDVRDVLANGNDGSTTMAACQVYNNGLARVYVRDDALTTQLSAWGKTDRPEFDMFDGGWHMIACAWEQGVAADVYVDGQLVATDDTLNSANTFMDWQYSMLLGAARQSTNRQMLTTGADMVVDSLRIYNYRFTDVTVFAQEYLDETGIAPCLDSAFEGNYFNTNNTGSSYCRVDLADFADYAAAWLSDGLY